MLKALKRYVFEPLAYGVLPLIFGGVAGLVVLDQYWVSSSSSTVRGRLEQKEPFERKFFGGYTVRVSGYPHDIDVISENWDKTAEVGDMLDLEVCDDPFGENKFCLKMDDGK